MDETLMMIKPDSVLPTELMKALVGEICRTGEAEVDCRGGQITVSLQGACLTINDADGDWVAVESREIAERFNIPSKDCKARYEMNGRDDEMLLYNEYLLINERLEAAGLFVIFDQYSEQFFGI